MEGSKNLHDTIREAEDSAKRVSKEYEKLRDQVEDNANSSVDLLGKINELVASRSEHPEEFLSKTNRVEVPQRSQATQTRRIFDKGYPRIPSTFYKLADQAFNFDSLMLGMRTEAEHSTHQFDSTKVSLSAIQSFSRTGQRICAVSPNETSAVEALDSLGALCGEDIVEALPSLAFWFSRRLQNTNTNFAIASVCRDVKQGNCSYRYDLSDRGSMCSSMLTPEMYQDRRTLGGLIVMYFNSEQPIQQQGRHDSQGSIAVPLIEGVSLLDAFVSCYNIQSNALQASDRCFKSNRINLCERIREIYYGEGEVASNTELGGMQYSGSGTSKASLVSVTELTMLNSLSILKASVNCMGMMMSEPDYIQSKQVSSRTPEPDSNNKKKRKGKVKSVRIWELRSPVLEDPPFASSNPAEFRMRQEHWRKSHYVRKPHGHAWRTRNPDGKEIVLPDGRTAHLILIRPTKVSASRMVKDE